MNLEGLREGLSVAKADKERVGRIVDEIQASLKYEGLALGDQGKDFLKAIREMKFGGFTLERSDALNLLTCLPFRRQWDIYGKLDTGRIQLHPISNETATFDPRAPEQTFDFCNFFSYRIAKVQRAKRSNCEKLLGYAVDLEFPEAGIHEAKPFYKFCRNVQHLQGNEAAWYACYGHLVDAIQFGLAGNEYPADETYVVALPFRACGWDHYLQIYLRPGVGYRKTDTELTAAQLSSDFSTDFEGRVWANLPSEAVERLSAIVDQTYKSIETIASQYSGNAGMPTRSTFLARFENCFRPKLPSIALARQRLTELLVEIRIAAFQQYVLQDPGNGTAEAGGTSGVTETKEEDATRRLCELFCRYAHNLAPVKGVQCGNKCYAYPRPGSDQTPLWRDVTPRVWNKLVREWQADYSLPVDIMTAPQVSAYLPWVMAPYGTDPANDALEKLLTNTSTQRLKAQLAWVLLVGRDGSGDGRVAVESPADIRQVSVTN